MPKTVIAARPHAAATDATAAAHCRPGAGAVSRHASCVARLPGIMLRRLRPGTAARLSAGIAAAALAGLGATSLHAAEPIPSGARLAATCAACHGTAGAASGTSLPALAGQPQAALLASLQAFKAGTRPATIMTQIAKGYTDEQLAQLAAFFAAQPAGKATGPGVHP